MDPRTGVDAVEETKISCLCQGLKSSTAAVQPIAVPTELPDYVSVLFSDLCLPDGPFP
jgi:hypothetical protein